MAEDLVMKKLSAEFNLKIIRQVKTKHDARYIFDGVVLVKNKFIVIEVKMLRRVLQAKIIVRKFIDRLNTYYTSLEEDEKSRFSLILAIVLDEGNPEDIIQQLKFIRDTSQYPVRLVCYRFNELQAEFGIQ